SLSLAPNGSLPYTMVAKFKAEDRITYKVNDGTIDGNTVSVTLTVDSVNDAPVATSDTYETPENTALVVAALAGVLQNDSDVDGSTEAARVGKESQHGGTSRGSKDYSL